MARPDKVIVGQGEMIHADIDVAGFAEAIDRMVQDVQFHLGAGQVRFIDHALTFEAFRQVRVVVYGEPVGPHACDDIKRLVETRD